MISNHTRGSMEWIGSKSIIKRYRTSSSCSLCVIAIRLQIVPFLITFRKWFLRGLVNDLPYVWIDGYGSLIIGHLGSGWIGGG